MNKRLGIIGVFVLGISSSMYRVSADKIVEVDLITALNNDDTVTTRAEYSALRLRALTTISHVLEDLSDAEEVLPLPLGQATKKEFDLLVTLANSDKTDASLRTVQEELQGDKHKLWGVITLARLYDPKDSKLTTLIFLKAIKELKEGYTAGLHAHDVAMLCQGLKEIDADEAYTKQEKQEAIQGLVKIKNLGESISNKQVAQLLEIIKKNAWEGLSNKWGLCTALNTYLYGESETEKLFPAVPNEQTGMPTEGVFPLSKQDLEKAGHNLVETNLSFTEQKLASLHDFAILRHYTALQELDLSHNNLMQLQPGMFLGLETLKKLVLSYNQIEEVQSGAFEGLTALQQLNLYRNQITKLQPGVFAGLPALQQLDLGFNRIEEVQSGAFEGLTVLQQLNLYVNNLMHLQPGVFSRLTSLETLNLGSNCLTKLQPEIFADLRSLRHLALSFNKIPEIQLETFADLTALEYLDLSYNELTEENKRAIKVVLPAGCEFISS